MLATTHQRIARTYYSRTFVQSRDAHVFLEYTYHRASSIRYLAKLLAIINEILEWNESPDTKPDQANTPAADAVYNGFRDCGKLLREALAGSSTNSDSCLAEVLRRLEILRDGDLWNVLRKSAESEPNDLRHSGGRGDGAEPADQGAWDLGRARSELKERHGREIKALYRAWGRAESLLRDQLPAQQLLHWCQFLLEDKITVRFNNVVVGYHKRGEVLVPDLWRIDGRAINLSAVDTCDLFAGFLRNLEVKLWIERSEFLEAAQARFWQLASSALDLNDPWKAKQFTDAAQALKASGRLGFDALHWLLDVATCFIKHFQARHRSGLPLDSLHPGALPDHKEAKALLDWVKRRLEPSGIVVGELLKENSGDRYEVNLRLTHLCAEVTLSTFSVFATKFSGEPLPNAGERMDVALEQTDVGLLACRSQDEHASGRPHGVVVEPAVDGSLYLPYRSVFFMLRGRAIWPRCLSDAAAGHVDDLAAHSEFASAFRNFEMARGGLGDDNALLAALNELYAVEACLAFARIRLYCAPGQAQEQRSSCGMLRPVRSTNWRGLGYSGRNNI